MEDSLYPNIKNSIKLDDFEGPLDLLLYLIKKNELDIYNIPIVTVTNQYIQIIKTMKELDLEIAGDFFVMASTLMYIKSRYLLPKKERDEIDDDDFEIDPRWELVQKLIAYKEYKSISYDLGKRIEDNSLYIKRNYIESRYQTKRRLHPSDKLEIWNTFNLVLKRLSEKIDIGQIQEENVTVSEKMEYIIKYSKKNNSFYFTELFSQQTTLNSIVATFLAILELTRLEKIFITQDVAFSDILCKHI